MSKIDNDRLLSEINIPGTHDSCTKLAIAQGPEDVTKAKENAINAVNAIHTKAEQPEEPTEETAAKTAAKNELDSLKNSMNEKDFDPADCRCEMSPCKGRISAAEICTCRVSAAA